MAMELKYAMGVLIFFLACSSETGGQQVRFRMEHQITGWGTMNFDDPFKYQAGVRYIPGINVTDSLMKNCTLDGEVSVNSWYSASFPDKSTDHENYAVNPYRVWLRFSTPRLEIRAGLQKINFGSASVLRPLMWFDRMDPRDPLRLTDGVYGLLGRYYFQDNTNIWLWALYGNTKPRGWDAVPSESKVPEFGGRFQFPVPRGEVALTIHRRKSDFTEFSLSAPGTADTTFPEEKFAMDGKIDVGIGLWGEFVIKHNNKANGVLKEWETYLNAGFDYTFPAGNGLTVATEYFRYRSETGWRENRTDVNYSVLTFNYPIGIMNNAMAMFYYNWEAKEWYRFLSLQRKYDYWTFFLMAFWNPDQFGLYAEDSTGNLFAGKGFQFMAVVNF